MLNTIDAKGLFLSEWGFNMNQCYPNHQTHQKLGKRVGSVGQ